MDQQKVGGASSTEATMPFPLAFILSSLSQQRAAQGPTEDQGLFDSLGSAISGRLKDRFGIVAPKGATTLDKIRIFAETRPKNEFQPLQPISPGIGRPVGVGDEIGPTRISS